MTITTKTYIDFDIQTLTDAVQGRFSQKNAFMGSRLMAAGAVLLSDTMPAEGQAAIGTVIKVPYFGILGSFASNPDGSSATPTTVAATSEDATVARSSMAFELSRWAQGNAPPGVDLYDYAADQVMIAAEREMDAQITTVAAATELVYDVYDATTPAYLTPDVLANARGRLWGDEGFDDLAGILLHSRASMGLSLLKDGTGNPLLQENFTTDGQSVKRFAGLTVVESDRAPIVGTMGAVSSVGTATLPVMTLAGTPTDLFEVRVRNTAGTTLGSSTTVQFSTNGGLNWSEDIVVADTSAIAMTDTAVDSLVGNNGTTGLTMAFSAAFTGTDNVFGANATANVTTLVLKKGSTAFWYNGAALQLQTDRNVLADTDIGAMHLYYAPHRYRRTPTGTKPGVLAIKHNVHTTAVTGLAALAI